MKPLPLFLLLVACGCASHPIRYAPPAEGPTAAIRYVNRTSDDISVSFYEQSLNCKRRRVTDRLRGEGESLFVVRADEPLTFQYHRTHETEGEASKYCLLNVRFTPVSGQEYVFEVVPGQVTKASVFDTVGEARSCTWRLRRAGGAMAGSEVSLETIPWETGWDENGSFCSR